MTDDWISVTEHPNGSPVEPTLLCHLPSNSNSQSISCSIDSVIFNLHPASSSELFHLWWQPSLHTLMNTNPLESTWFYFPPNMVIKKGPSLQKTNLRWIVNEPVMQSIDFFSLLFNHSTQLMSACSVYLNTVNWKDLSKSEKNIQFKFFLQMWGERHCGGLHTFDYMPNYLKRTFFSHCFLNSKFKLHCNVTLLNDHLAFLHTVCGFSFEYISMDSKKMVLMVHKSPNCNITKHKRQ